MWTNQDQMFASGEKRVETKIDAEEKAITLLDKVACRIADGDVTVRSIEYGPTNLDPFEGGYTSERLTVEFYN